ncbi:MAG: hypothetical protein NC132_05045 [Corallococcus sp.]|nr:hypothetical protein [Corallococcus sp.]MCM1360148.1 hypothetical protein [Corallococcus sp.]MCM1395463.1 hypothetical protein [Corallococcus sp.]
MAFFFFDGSKTLTTVLIVLGIAFAAVVLGVVLYKLIRSVVTNKKAKEEQKLAQAVDNAAERKIMEKRNEFLVMSRNVTYSVGVDGEIAVGKYVLKNAVESETTFNLRLNGLVENHANGDTVTLGAGDTLCAVSGSVLIKPFVD